MDVDELQHALGGIVLEAAYMERVLRAASSALVGSKYAAVVDGRMAAATRPAPRSLLNREWAISPKPPWFVDNKTAATTGRLLTSFEAHPRWAALPAIFASALRG